jgi:hypothetical protein
MKTRKSSLRKIIAGIFVFFICMERWFKVDLDFNLVKKKKAHACQNGQTITFSFSRYYSA